MKKRIFICIAFLLLLLMAGCKKEEAEVSTEKVYLEFYNRKREVYEVMEEIIKGFNASQDKIEVIQIMNTNAEVPLKISSVTNEFPDIVMLSGLQNTETTEYILGGHMLELEEMGCIQKIKEEYRSAITYDGHIYQIPLSIGFEGIYLNKDLFLQEGLKIPGTYEELIEVCQEIQKRGKVPFVFADAEGWAIHQSWECIQSVSTNDFGEVFESVARGETTFYEHPVSRRSMEKLIELHQFTDMKKSVLNYDEAMNCFAEGEAFMFIQGSWAYSNLRRRMAEVEIEMIPFPAEEGEEQYFTLWVDSSIGISKTCKYPKEAKEFLEYLMQPEVLGIYLETEDAIGCMEGIKSECEYAPQINEVVRKGRANVDATWIPSPTSVIRDEDIVSLMSDADRNEIETFMNTLSKSLKKHSKLFLEVKEKRK